jgi:hypothetical protein
MKRKQQTKCKPPRYSYHRDFTGSAARIRILNPDGESVLNIYFWDDPKTTEATAAEKKAKMLVAAMNLKRGGTVELPHPFARLAERREIAAIWTVRDVQRIRPDLTEDQAWAVLREIDCDIFNRGITWETLRLTADKMFPTTSAAA